MSRYVWVLLRVDGSLRYCDSVWTSVAEAKKSIGPQVKWLACYDDLSGYDGFLVSTGGRTWTLVKKYLHQKGEK